jgi:hypothetical protein
MAINIKSIGWNTSNTTINDAIKQITTFGVQRPNRYAVEFVNCPVIQSGGSQYNFFATMVQIPQRTITFFSDSVGPYSPTWDVPLKSEYDDHYIINFVVDKTWGIRKLIDTWMDYINNRDTTDITGYVQGQSAYDANIQSANGGTSYSKIKITGTATNDNSLQGTLVLHHAWPKLILPTQFDTGAVDQPLIMSVDFSYRYYTYEEETGTAVPVQFRPE